MEKDIRNDIEEVFVTSSSTDELFDAFRVALYNKVNDEELYKRLLSNKALSTDEITMYAEKICKEFPELCYPVYFWVGQIFSSISSYSMHTDKAFYFLKKAAAHDASNEAPYIEIIQMYNKDLDYPPLEDIINLVQDRIKTAEKKSRICFKLSRLYKELGNVEEEKTYQKLGERFQREGR